MVRISNADLCKYGGDCDLRWLYSDVNEASVRGGECI